MRVSELITEKEINVWKQNDIITIKAGCGVGKSYFIKNILYKVAKEQDKKILFLIHRTNCVNQFQNEIEKDNKTDIIDIKTYQYLENKVLNKKGIDLTQYDYIVSDEFHYFISDAAFNKITDISLDLILSQNAIKVFMSATGDDMKRYINNIKQIKTSDYELPIKYNFIANLTFFNKDESEEKFIEEAIQKQQKAIFFIQSAKKAYELSQKYKDYCLFNCSKNNEEYYKYVDTDKINKMLEQERFEELILITTTCMDAGVNITDTEVKHIVIDVQDKGFLIQCLGRRRIQNQDDKLYVYIKTLSNLVLGGKITQLKHKIEMADFFKEHTVKEFVDEYTRECDTNNIVYDIKVKDDDKCSKKLNELMYFKCKLDIIEFDTMLKNGKHGYNKYISDTFGIKRYRIIEESYEKSDLEKYLETIIGKKLFKDDRKELINKINLRQNGKLLKGEKSLNAALEERKIKYEIIIVKANKEEKLHWVIQKIKENKETLEQYLNKILNSELDKNKQKELINRIELKDGKGRIQKSITILNSYLKENELKYVIKSKRKNTKVDEKIKKVSYWIIENE